MGKIINWHNIASIVVGIQAYLFYSYPSATAAACLAFCFTLAITKK